MYLSKIEDCIAEAIINSRLFIGGQLTKADCYDIGWKVKLLLEEDPAFTCVAGTCHSWNFFSVVRSNYPDIYRCCLYCGRLEKSTLEMNKNTLSGWRRVWKEYIEV